MAPRRRSLARRRGTTLASWLTGQWSVSRAINGRHGAFRGAATFIGDGDGGVSWHETGRLLLDAYDRPASRTLAVVPAPGLHADTWEVRFDDGRSFHPLDLTTGRWNVEHLCGPDIYAGAYTVLGQDELSVLWRVRGPGRDDTIASRYRRRDAPAEDPPADPTTPARSCRRRCRDDQSSAGDRDAGRDELAVQRAVLPAGQRAGR